MPRVYSFARVFFPAGMLMTVLLPAAPAQKAPVQTPQALLPGKGPVIGTLDFYGLRKVTEAKVRQALGVREGDLLPSSKGDDRAAFGRTIPGVVEIAP